MCRTGGRRCKRASEYSTAVYKLKDQIRYAQAKGDETKVALLERKIELLEIAHEQYGDTVSPYDITISPEVDELITHLESAGMDPMVVGGTVRDAYSGETPKDIDIEVYGTNVNTLIKHLKTKYPEVNTVGKSFGVIKIVLENGEDIDLSLPRKDNKTGEGHRGFIVDTESDLTMEEATSRRDYTINSMLWSPHKEALVDIHGGSHDMKNKTLRHVSEAFTEDPLRVLRGFQFASRMGFDMAPETSQLSQSITDTYHQLPQERVVGEWEKFYRKGVHVSNGLKVLRDTTWDTHFSGLNKINTPEFRERLDKGISRANIKDKDQRVRVISSAIAREIGEKDGPRFLEETVNTDKAKSKSRFLAYAQPTSKTSDSIKHFAYNASKMGITIQEWHQSMRLSTNKEQREYAEYIASRAKRLGVYNTPEEPIVTGKIIMSNTAQKPGKWMGEVISEALDLQYKGKIKNQEEAILWIVKRVK